jgi:probable phosphoglycerate mutase
MKFYLFRHGETDWNKESRIQGSTNTQLNSRGIQQAKDLIPLLEELDLEVIYTSDLNRAYHTGKIVADAFDIPIHKEVRLREANFGEAEGKTVDQIINDYGLELWESFRIMDLKNKEVSFPGGEQRWDSVLRMRSVVEDLVARNEYERVGISTHGGVVRNLLHSFLAEDHPPLPIPNCVTYLLEEREGSFFVEGPLK